MNNLEQIESRLWDYIDGNAGANEKSAIEKLIAENAEWRLKYAELLELHSSINLSELEQPSMRFTKNVMEEIARLQITPAARNYINQKVIWGIGMFFIIMLGAFLVYGIAQIDWSAGTNTGKTLGVDFSKVNYSSMFNNTFMNVFMMLNIVLGLFLLDRYLANKRNKLIHKPGSSE
ncbi:MAG: anti-sigma factor family protein [Flavisolibacter sp.]